MRYIKVLSMFVILVVALLLISTIRTYAGFGPAAAIVQCDGDLEVIKTAISETDSDCDTGSGDDCEPGVGNSCAACLEACIEVDYSGDISQSGTGKITYLLTIGNPEM